MTYEEAVEVKEALKAILNGTDPNEVVAGLSEGPHNWRGRHRQARFHGTQNRDGMTYDEWYNSVAFGAGGHGRTPLKSSPKLRKAWRAGEDPTGYLLGESLDETANYKIMGKYKGHAPEEIDTAATKQEAVKLLKEYKMAYSKEWQLWID